MDTENDIVETQSTEHRARGGHCLKQDSFKRHIVFWWSTGKSKKTSKQKGWVLGEKERVIEGESDRRRSNTEE